MEEDILYDSNGIKITNRLARFQDKSFAVANITSVQSRTQENRGRGPLIMIFSGIALLLIQVFSLMLSSGINYTWAGLGLLLLVGGILLARNVKDIYIVELSTSGGQVSAYTSRDRGTVQAIVNALNHAIIRHR